VWVVCRRLEGNIDSVRKVASIGAWVLLGAAVACGGKTAVRDFSSEAGGDKMLLERGQGELEEKHWEDARGYFQQLTDTFPRSQYVGDARIGIADSYFYQKGVGNIVLAIAEYRDVLTFFPNHPRADYVQYQIAYAYYRQKHGSDRDQDPTRTAVEELEKLIDLYPNSPYAETGRELLQDCNELLAEHEFMVGRFYLKVRKHCDSTIARLKGVLENYPTFSRADEVYFHLGEAHTLCGSPTEAMPYYKQLIDNYPGSSFKDEAEKRLGALRAKADEGLKIP
jgi:outer membrane protein assembly factor BamD